MNSTLDAARQLVNRRTLRAPRDLVLKMWSDSEHLARWWGPNGFSTTTHEFDFRPGGKWILTMHGPDGCDYANEIHYLETGPDRIVYESRPADPNAGHRVEVTFKETENGDTEMEFVLTFASPEMRQMIVEKFGAEKGLVQTTARLDALLADERATTAPFKLVISLPSDTEIRSVRALRAPRELVFKAHTTAEMIKVWQCPDIFECIESTYDARPGGKWTLIHRQRDNGETYRFNGDVLEVDRPNRVVSTFEYEGFPGVVRTNTVTFREFEIGVKDRDPRTSAAVLTTGGIGTLVTTTISFANQTDRDQMLNSGMEWGMSLGYENLQKMADESEDQQQALAAKIEGAIQEVLQAKAQMLSALKTTPDDRLNWSPSETARTPLQLVAHSAYSAKSVHDTMDGRTYATPTPELADIEFLAWEKQFTTRQEVIDLLENNVGDYISWVRTLTPERLVDPVTLPFGMGEVPLSVMLTIPAQHTNFHTAQLVYLQTIYGDRDWWLGV